MNKEMLQGIGMMLVPLVIPLLGGLYLALAFAYEDYIERQNDKSAKAYCLEDDYIPFNVESVSLEEWIAYLDMRNKNGHVSIKEWLERCKEIHA